MALHSERWCLGTCLLHKFSQHFLGGFGGEKGGHIRCKQDSAERARGNLGVSRLSDYSCPRGQREKLGVSGGAGQRLLARLLSVSRLGWDRMTGVS